MSEQDNLQLSDYQRAELYNAFRLFNPNSEGKINISTLVGLLSSFESASTEWQSDRKNERFRIHRVQSLSESNSPLTESLTKSQPRTELKFSFHSFPDNSSECDFETFTKLIEDNLTSPEAVEDCITHAFKLMDIRKLGRIEAQDLQTIAGLLGEPIESEGEAQRLLHLMTALESNSPSFDEFYEYVKKTLKPQGDS